MRIRKNGKVIRLTESDLMRITRKVLREQDETKTTNSTVEMNTDMAKLFDRMNWFKENITKKIKPGEQINMNLTVSKDTEMQGIGTVLKYLNDLCNENELSSDLCGDEDKLYKLGRAAQKQYKKLKPGKLTVQIGQRYTY